MLQRHDLQQMNEPQVAQALTQAFAQHCSRRGPSIDAETYKKIRPYQGCGSQIPLMGRSCVMARKEAGGHVLRPPHERHVALDDLALHGLELAPETLARSYTLKRVTPKASDPGPSLRS